MRCGIWLRITRILEPAIGRSKTVLAIANNTFSIMMNHFVGFMIVKMSFFGVGRLFGIMQDFDLHWCLEAIWYYYFPGGVYQIGVLYIIGGIAIPILIQICINKAKAKLKVG